MTGNWFPVSTNLSAVKGALPDRCGRAVAGTPSGSTNSEVLKPNAVNRASTLAVGNMFNAFWGDIGLLNGQQKKSSVIAAVLVPCQVEIDG